jgi:hypothetical protein
VTSERAGVSGAEVDDDDDDESKKASSIYLQGK